MSENYEQELKDRIAALEAEGQAVLKAMQLVQQQILQKQDELRQAASRLTFIKGAVTSAREAYKLFTGHDFESEPQQ